MEYVERAWEQVYHFRLLYKKPYFFPIYGALRFGTGGMWELYIDDLLVQTHVYGGAYPLPAAGAGRLGLVCTGGAAAVLADATSSVAHESSSARRGCQAEGATP